MRASVRWTITLAVAGTLVFGLSGLLQLRQEQRSLHRTVERELALLGGSLRVTTENALRDRQIADVSEVVLRLDAIDRGVDVYLYDAGDQRVEIVKGVEPNTQVEESLRTMLVRREPAVALPGPALWTAPLYGEDQSFIGSIAVVRPMHDVEADLRSTRWAIALSVLWYVVLSSVLGMFLGTVYVTRPLEDLLKAIGEVRQGRLAGRLGRFRDDEIGAVAAEFDAMRADLERAREQLALQAEERREWVRALHESSKLAAIGQLSASIAHEIGSPLQVMLGRAQSLAEQPKDAERTQRYAQILVRETERVSRIVDRLLSVARRPKAEGARVNLNIVAGDVVELLQWTARKQGITLKREGEDAFAWANPDEAHQVLLNLLQNALQACQSGDAVTVSVTNSEGVVVEVRDSGRGMAEETIRRLPEPFFTTRAEVGGRGLGLTIVHEILKEHGGHLVIQSALGQGTTVTATWPVAEPS